MSVTCQCGKEPLTQTWTYLWFKTLTNNIFYPGEWEEQHQFIELFQSCSQSRQSVMITFTAQVLCHIQSCVSLCLFYAACRGKTCELLSERPEDPEPCSREVMLLTTEQPVIKSTFNAGVELQCCQFSNTAAKCRSLQKTAAHTSPSVPSAVCHVSVWTIHRIKK